MQRKPKSSAPTIYWFRQDLRLSDNPALSAAVTAGSPVIALYILDDDAAGRWAMGGASRWWLHHSLTALDASLKAKGGRLVVRRGDSAAVLNGIIDETKAGTVFWNRRYEPAAVAQDTKIKADLSSRGIEVQSFNAALLFEPWQVKTQAGEPFKVFTPFWRACQARPMPDTIMPAPKSLPATPANVKGESIAVLGLLPEKPNWAARFPEFWSPGEIGAEEKLGTFIDSALGGYSDGRDRPSLRGTSMLSPHLHFGEIGPRQVWRAIRFAEDRSPGAAATQSDKYLSEIGWREFSYHLLYQAPHLPERCFRPEYDAFPWEDDRAGLAAWRKGLTGVPIVDAGMRQLWTFGWMHNRVRMIVASFLVKHLLVPWQQGADWFWDTLVDADLASNSASWQWVAGCGADAAPYFRIFNPVLQGERFDTQGEYVRALVPELAAMPPRFIHKPWEAPAEVLSKAGVALGRSYPRPIVDLQRGRERALAAFGTLKSAA